MNRFESSTKLLSGLILPAMVDNDFGKYVKHSAVQKMLDDINDDIARRGFSHIDDIIKKEGFEVKS